MIGSVKGYAVCNITNKKLDKEEFLTELVQLDSNLKNKILEALNNDGYVIGLKKKEILKVDWNDIEIVPNESSSFSGITFSTCLSLGLLYGIIFSKLLMGLLFGCVIGLCFGTVAKKKK